MTDSEWEAEMERSIDSRGRSRSRSIIGETNESPESNTVDEEQLSRIQQCRRRSQSFSSINDEAESDCEPNEDVAKRAAALSKVYLAGSTPVDVTKLPDDKKTSKVKVVQPTGALSAQALDVLSEGLQLSLDSSLAAHGRNTWKPTEEELEEKQMEEDEKKRSSMERNSKQSLASKAALFKSRMFKATSKLPLSSSRSLTEQPCATDQAVPPKKHKLKLLLLGDSGVGKTSLMRVFSGDKFSDSMLATAGVDFKLRQVSIAGQDITLQIWDTAGQERFHRITATYYKGANGIVLVYDVTDKRGFDNVEYWMNNIRQFSSPHLPAMLLVGNKIDLSNRSVPSRDGEAIAKQYNCRFIETSAKTSENINDALETIARDALIMSVNPELTQKSLILKGSKHKENCVIS
ncbi:unnamed protein product [Albugo candida]|uniref:Uncharacterized protein n=2 Tax=Albugo candida TaxID=65357 RepID=A0A024GHF3_9STRA|nr:unnamed protein product [Albugo candida]|eukprot:CCI46323.1 unnamed protein product [Albugo candida]